MSRPWWNSRHGSLSHELWEPHLDSIESIEHDEGDNMNLAFIKKGLLSGVHATVIRPKDVEPEALPKLDHLPRTYTSPPTQRLGRHKRSWTSMENGGDADLPPQPTFQRTKKIVCNPLPEQRTIFRDWMNASRWVFNRCMLRVQSLCGDTFTEDTPAWRKELLRHLCQGNYLRDSCSRIKRTLPNYQTVLRTTPSTILASAAQQCAVNLLCNLTRLNRRRCRHFSLRLQDANSSPVVSLDPLMVEKYLPLLNLSEPLPAVDTEKPVNQTCRLVYHPFSRRYELHIPVYVCQVERSRTGDPRGICAIDPGVRSFLTLYSPDLQLAVELGKGDMERRIAPLLAQLDAIQKILDDPDTPPKSQKRRHLRTKLGLIRVRMQRIMSDIHHRVARFLIDSFHTIYIPQFQVHSIVNRYGRTISSTTARNVFAWSHGAFRECLVQMAQLTENTKVILCSEEYTSKTCSRCGQLNESLGDSKSFCCPHCNLMADRDVNAAKNIYLKSVF